MKPILRGDVKHEDRPRSIRYEDFDKELRRRNRGGGRPPTLWEQFEKALSDLTHPMRKMAWERIKGHRFQLEEQIRSADPRMADHLRHQENKLGQDFTAAVAGGTRGAWVALRILATLPAPDNNSPG